MNNNLKINIHGPAGAGKTVAARLIYDVLAANGITVIASCGDGPSDESWGWPEKADLPELAEALATRSMAEIQTFTAKEEPPLLPETLWQAKALDIALLTLNRAFQDDPSAIHALLCNRVPCNDQLVDHPTVQVESNELLGKTSYTVGALGVLNGVIEALTGERVASKWNEERDAEGRSRLLGFCKYEKPASHEPGDSPCNKPTNYKTRFRVVKAPSDYDGSRVLTTEEVASLIGADPKTVDDSRQVSALYTGEFKFEVISCP
jgi:hypothetical protein